MALGKRMTLQLSGYSADVDGDFAPVLRNTSTKEPNLYRKFFKRVCDVAFTLAIAPIVLPFVAAAAFLIAMDGRNPFYSQMRIGKGGKEFRMWKLRTMVHNADALLDAYLAENPVAKLEYDSTQKLKKDPRITLVGRILRKTSLDELPQLWNVFLGDMSVVGPRPMLPHQKGSYFGKAYYRLQPGVTGLWQVSDRNEGEFIGRVRYDEIYDRVCSFRTDVQVLLRTVVVVVRCTGY